jgi:hypothetical protein
MLASLLPGLRELRTPLAAGYIWLVFVYFVAGTPTEITDDPGPFESLLTVIPQLGAVATGFAVSFVAYLVGSISQDVFAQILPAVLSTLERYVRLARARMLFFGRRAMFRAQDELEFRLARLHRFVAEASQSLPGAQIEERLRPPPEVQDEVRADLETVSRTLRELAAEGKSEAEKPEALRPMVEAEEKLRVAIVPPLVAVMGALIVIDSTIWLLGFAFTLALLVQALARRLEANRLAAQYYRARDVAEVEEDLRSFARALEDEAVDLPALKRLDAALRRVTQSRLDRPDFSSLPSP